MPIPSLPLEIVGEIVSHLRAPLKRDTHKAVEAGQALSLVCRRWYPIGQELRWKDLRIDIASVPSLLTHFDLYPHLPQLVTAFTQLKSSKSRSNSSDLDALGDVDGGGFDLLPKLLTSLHKLQALALRDVPSTFESVFEAAAGLSYLLSALLVTTNGLTWSSKIDSIFAQGFPSLRQFGLDAGEVTVEATAHFRPATIPLKRLEELRWSSVSPNVSNLLETILSTVDPAALRACSFINRSEHQFLADWIAKCSNLQTFLVAGNRQFLTSTFPTLLSSLPQAGSLTLLSISVLEVEESHPSPIPLATIFASAPLSLRVLQARQIRFPDTSSFEDYPLSSFNKSGNYLLIQGLISTSVGDRCVHLWKEIGEEESRGYRCVHEFTTWEEYDARRLKSA